VPVLAAAPPSAYRLGDAAPVLRLSGDVSGLTTSQGLTLLDPAFDPSRAGRLGATSALSRTELARRIAAGRARCAGSAPDQSAGTRASRQRARTPLDVKATVMSTRGL
jgi:hypothetical protein